jgi:hypothetical protein
MSALLLEADILIVGINVCYVPEADLMMGWLIWFWPRRAENSARTYSYGELVRSGLESRTRRS